MKTFTLLLVVAFSVFLLATTWLDQQKTETYKVEKNHPVAVVELFTSEGCSSCPPADQLLSEIVDRNQDQVFGLSFHVSYWNRLGWTDPFSSDAYTDRQKNYATVLKNTQVYTPQMIVNGTEVFVGSNRSKANEAIQVALKQPAKASLQLTGEVKEKTVQIHYAIKDFAPAYQLHVALVQRNINSHVLRGENRGRTLHHDNVVRAFTTVTNASGTLELALPEDMDLKNASIIGYVQDGKNMEIVGASLWKLKPV